MKKFTTLAITALALMSVTSAFGQGMMKSDHMMKKPMMGKMHGGPMMKGLTPAEQKTAMHMMGKLSPAEKAALMKMGEGGKMSKMDKMHADSGMKKMTPAEKAVGMKMMKMHKMHHMGMMKKPMMAKPMMHKG